MFPVVAFRRPFGLFVGEAFRLGFVEMDASIFRFDVYYTPNARVKLVREMIRSYAVEHRLACWDWYEIAGGEGSSSQWRKAGFMAYDRTHCTETGYRVQGEMLYRALMKAYQEYVDRVAQ